MAHQLSSTAVLLAVLCAVAATAALSQRPDDERFVGVAAGVSNKKHGYASGYESGEDEYYGGKGDGYGSSKKHSSHGGYKGHGKHGKKGGKHGGDGYGDKYDKYDKYDVSYGKDGYQVGQGWVVCVCTRAGRDWVRGPLVCGVSGSGGCA